MKTITFLLKIVTSILIGAGCFGTAIAAPAFDIDFYGGDTALLQGEYDTGTDLKLADGESVSVDILISGLEVDNGLNGWTLLLEYGSSLAASNLQVNTILWPSAFRLPDIQEGFLTAEGLSLEGIEGDDLLLFSFDLVAVDSTIAAVLTLWDFDKGGNLADVVTEQNELLDGSQLPASLATVNNVPIPSALILLAGGLAGLAALRKNNSAL